MITPKLYAWKGTKWIRKIEFLARDQKGFWEVRGYSNSAEPWFNDRIRELRLQIADCDWDYPDFSFAPHLGKPPAQADQQESRILEELRRLALEGVADKLQHPAEDEQRRRHGPEALDEPRDDKQRQRHRDQRDAEGVTERG